MNLFKYSYGALLFTSILAFGVTGCPSTSKDTTETGEGEGEGSSEGEGAEGEGSEGEGAEGEGAEGEGSEGEGAEGEGTGDYSGFSGTFADIVTVNDSSSALCVIYWDAEGSAVNGSDACPDCLWT